MRPLVVQRRMFHMLHAPDDDLLVDAAHADPFLRLVNPSPRSDGARRSRHTPIYLSPWGEEVVVGAKSGLTRSG